MEAELKTLLGPITGGIIVLVITQVAQVIWAIVKGGTKDLRDNTHAIIQLQVEMKHAIEKLSSIPEMQNDINGLGSAMREMRAQFAINKRDQDQ